MTELRFTVYGKPVAWARARKGRGKGAFFTDPKTASFERRVALAAQEAMLPEYPGIRLQPLTGAVSLDVAAYWPALKGAKETSAEATRKPTRPDADNVLKGVMDALNGIVYVDDGQVTDATVKKRHCDKGGTPGVSVVVRSLDREWS